MRATNLLAAIVAPVLLAACATSGTHRYSCGVPDGPACQSVLTTYAQTHGHVAPVPTNPGPVAGARAPFRTALRLAQNLEGDLVFEAEEDRKSRSTPDSVPEREPAVVMRIWIAPWQDARGDLHGATYRYTEIAPARWRYGNVPVEPRTPFHRVGTATSGHATNTDPETHPAAEEAP